MKYIIYHPDEPEWEPWTLADDEEMVQFAKDAEFTYFLWLAHRVVVRQDVEGNLSILQNRRRFNG